MIHSCVLHPEMVWHILECRYVIVVMATVVVVMPIKIALDIVAVVVAVVTPCSHGNGEDGVVQH